MGGREWEKKFEVTASTDENKEREEVTVLNRPVTATPPTSRST